METLDLPSALRLFAAIDATWPPEERVERDGWVLRRDSSGSKRVSAATPLVPGTVPEIAAAEAVMRGWGQPPMFSIREGDEGLDGALAARGYGVVDRCVLYLARCAALDGGADQTARAIRVSCPLAVVDEIWRAGGIGPGRRAVMARPAGARMVIMARLADRPAGVAFVACDGPLAMIHAIEVATPFRRQGAGAILLEGAARFAAENGAEWLGLAVTEANMPARALYEKLGMADAARYHYRIHAS